MTARLGTLVSMDVSDDGRVITWRFQRPNGALETIETDGRELDETTALLRSACVSRLQAKSMSEPQEERGDWFQWPATHAGPPDVGIAPMTNELSLIWGYESAYQVCFALKPDEARQLIRDLTMDLAKLDAPSHRA